MERDLLATPYHALPIPCIYNMDAHDNVHQENKCAQEHVSRQNLSGKVILHHQMKYDCIWIDTKN